jgi:glycosyltransferase involved in cell wall biosynthesis
MANPVPRVVFITGADPLRGKGGGTNIVRSHARAAHAAGYESHMFCLSDRDEVIATDYGFVHRVRTPLRPPGTQDWGQEQARVGALKNFTRWFVYSPFASRLQKPVLVRAIESFLAGASGPVVLHGFWLWGIVALAVAARRQRRGIATPVAVCMYTTGAHELAGKIKGAAQSGPRSPIWWLYRVEALWQHLFTKGDERRVCHDADVLLFDFESSRQLITKTHGACANARKISSCPASAFDALDFSTLRAHVAPTLGAPPLIVTVSRHDGRKGLAVLLRALALLRSRNIPFRARIGSGGELLEFHRVLSRELGLADCVDFTGWLADPNALLASGDIYVLPSLEEGSGSIALMEAMRAGLAIVASRVDGIPESINEGRDGVLVTPGDPVELADALQALLPDADRRAALGAAAVAAYRQRHSPEALTRDLGTIYGELLSAESV